MVGAKGVSGAVQAGGGISKSRVDAAAPPHTTASGARCNRASAARSSCMFLSGPRAGAYTRQPRPRPPPQAGTRPKVGAGIISLDERRLAGRDIPPLLRPRGWHIDGGAGGGNRGGYWGGKRAWACGPAVRCRQSAGYWGRTRWVERLVGRPSRGVLVRGCRRPRHPSLVGI